MENDITFYEFYEDSPCCIGFCSETKTYYFSIEGDSGQFMEPVAIKADAVATCEQAQDLATLLFCDVGDLPVCLDRFFTLVSPSDAIGCSAVAAGDFYSSDTAVTGGLIN